MTGLIALSIISTDNAMLFLSFRDQILTAWLFAFGVYCVTSECAFTSPLHNTPSTFLTVFSVYVGNYIYKFLQDMLLRKELPLYKIDLLHHFVTAMAFAVLIAYEQNAISGVIGLLFEGSVLLFDFNNLIRLLRVNKTGLVVLWSSILRVVFTVLLRAICPIALLIITISRYSPLSMDYLPLGYFFTNIVFFSMVNAWFIKISIESLRNRIWARHFFHQLSLPSENRNIEPNRNGLEQEMNNSNPGNQTIRSPLPVIIPTDAKFRLLSPVSNVNMNSDEVSNITVSRHERTLPQINVIIHDRRLFNPDQPVNQV